VIHPEWKGARDNEGRPWLTCSDLPKSFGECCGSCVSDGEYGYSAGGWQESPDALIYFEGCCNHDLRHLAQERWDALLVPGGTLDPEGA